MSRVSAALLGGVAATATSLVVAVISHGHSEFYDIVKQDQSWLEYLPNGDTGLELHMVGLNGDNATGAPSRRVDIAESTTGQTASLCFAKSEREVMAACPGSTFLGHLPREMDLTFVSQVGETEGFNWFEILSAPPGRLEDLAFLE